MDTKCPHRYPSAEIMSRPDLLDAYLPESFPVLTEKKPQVSGTTFCCVETIILASIQGGRLGKILPAAPILQHHTKGIPNVPQKWVEQVLSARNRPSPALRHDDTNATGNLRGQGPKRPDNPSCNTTLPLPPGSDQAKRRMGPLNAASAHVCVSLSAVISNKVVSDLPRTDGHGKHFHAVLSIARSARLQQSVARRLLKSRI